MITVTRDGTVHCPGARHAPLAWPLCGVASPYFKLIHVTMPRLILTTFSSLQCFLKVSFSLQSLKSYPCAWYALFSSKFLSYQHIPLIMSKIQSTTPSLLRNHRLLPNATRPKPTIHVPLPHLLFLSSRRYRILTRSIPLPPKLHPSHCVKATPRFRTQVLGSRNSTVWCRRRNQSPKA
jgi:hypothetical protein